MSRSQTGRRLTAITIALGMLGTAALAQPPRRSLDPIAEARARQQIADQKAESEVLAAIKDTERLARANPARAVQTLKAAQVNIDLAVSLSGETRKSLTSLLQGKIAQLEGRPLANPGVKLDPKAAAVKKNRQAEFDSMNAEIKVVNESIQTIAKYKRAGLNAEAEREIARLAKAYPNNPAVLRLQDQDAFSNRVEDSIEYNRQMDKRMLLAMRSVDTSALPPIGDIEFPKDWKEKTKRRSTEVKLTAHEKKIIEALDKPISVNWNGKMLEEALQELSTQMDQNLFIDKKSLSDLGIDLQKPITLQANTLSTRTVLRQLLAAQGLTFVVKDESIQVVTVEKARDMLVTRGLLPRRSRAGCRPLRRRAAVGHLPRLPANDGQRRDHHQDDHQVHRPVVLEGEQRAVYDHLPLSEHVDYRSALPRRFTPLSGRVWPPSAEAPYPESGDRHARPTGRDQWALLLSDHYRCLGA